MAYCTVSDVQARCKKFTISGTSKPTETEVEGFIDQCAAELDGITATLGYTTPVTGTESLKLLKKANADGAAFYTYNAAFSAVSPNASTLGAEYQEEWKHFLSMLRRGEIILTDAPTSTHRQGEPRGSALSSNFIDDDGETCLDPFVEKDTEW